MNDRRRGIADQLGIIVDYLALFFLSVRFFVPGTAVQQYSFEIAAVVSLLLSSQ